MGIRAALAACAALLVATNAAAANLVLNGDFDTDTSGWIGNASFGAGLDEAGDPGSGSLLVSNVNAGTGTEAFQRIAVTPGTPLVASFRVYIESGQDGVGYAYPGLNFYTGGCGGSFLANVNADLVDEPFDTWITSAVAETVVPPTADCVDAVLFVRNDGATGTFAASFDAIFVPEPGAAASGVAAVLALGVRRRSMRRAAGRAVGASRSS